MVTSSGVSPGSSLGGGAAGIDGEVISVEPVHWNKTNLAGSFVTEDLLISPLDVDENISEATWKLINRSAGE
ncbi:hypothetical protein BCON_0009g00420 [Botryotinia convoluta]|uniref:Uncharacterized protein n=1 Tax=Botryotinia convoluta TaxID=54673 RepID=A0A4Z1J4M5_9HELO|nr:hypothetical protein BCON_0009g00420 [Botryotinia convoluta]